MSRSHVFTVRLWAEEVAGGREYRGEVTHLLSGVRRPFRHWRDLEAFLTEAIETGQVAPTGPDRASDEGAQP